MDGNFELYKVFFTVASCGNISTASEKLFISQPAVSKSIRKLEGSLGVTLFSRNSRGVRLTEEGRVFCEYVERALNEITIGEKVLGKLRKREQGNIKIGVSTTLCKHVLIPKLKNFIKEYPDIEIKIINKTSFDSLQLVESGEVDLCIVSEPLEESEVHNFIKLSEIQDIFVVGKGYLESLNISSEENIFSLGTLMFLEGDNITRKYIDRYFQNNNMFVKPDIEISNMDLLVEFAKIGLGVTVAIKNFVKEELKEGSLVELPINPPVPKRNIGVVYHKNIPLSIAARTFLEYIL